MSIRIKSALRRIALIFAVLLSPTPGQAAGSIPVALSQQMDSNGKPLVGALLYLYVVGTVAQPQLAFQDTGLTLPLPWPVPADANGRLPMFYLADGSIHARLTDASGSVQFDYPSMLVIGPSGGGGGGSSVDPTAIASTGDTKFRPTAETLSGWVKLNGLTIGNAVSGASGRANADTQNLFVYLWTNCDDTHCPVLGGRGANGLADFNANKQLTTPDWRARAPVGMDCMGAPCAGRFAGVPFVGADTGATPGGLGGENTHTLTIAQMPSHDHGGVNGTFLGNNAGVVPGGNSRIQLSNAAGGDLTTTFAGVGGNGIIALQGGGGAMNVMSQFQLGTWYMRL